MPIFHEGCDAILPVVTKVVMRTSPGVHGGPAVREYEGLLFVAWLPTGIFGLLVQSGWVCWGGYFNELQYLVWKPPFGSARFGATVLPAIGDLRVFKLPHRIVHQHGRKSGDKSMAIPDFQALMLPVLKESAAGEVRITDVVATLGAKLALSEAELSELLPSGKQTTFANRVNWAKSYLGKAGLIRLTKRAYFEISERGQAVLANPPQTINIKFLESFPEFKAFRDATAVSPATPQAEPTNFKELAPDEVIRSASDELQQSLSAELLAKILASPPDFFERLVVQLLIAMGYGGSAIEAGKALGKSGDGGVDGVIDQDALGLDRIYVQAKRYTDNKVSSGEIRDFFGSLDRFKANKGLFVTTSSFSPSARETADLLSKRIVLIDGRFLTRLMIRFDIGCRVEEVVYIKKLDEDFFD